MMVNYLAALDGTFAALADPTRRAILEHLARSPESSVTEIAEPFAVSLPAVSRHLRVLEGTGLVARRKQGRVHHLRLAPAPLESASQWLDRYRKFWEARLDALERSLRDSNGRRPRPRRPRKARRPHRPRAPGGRPEALPRRNGPRRRASEANPIVKK
jgi:DNA-binding transcriptional ArsR family regulator